jgi:hypothetical protein
LYNQVVAASDILYLQCLKCTQFVVLFRTSTGQIPEPDKIAAFIVQHLTTCHPFNGSENLDGFSGFRVLPWSDCLRHRDLSEYKIGICSSCGHTATHPHREGWTKDGDAWVCGACQLFTVNS